MLVRSSQLEAIKFSYQGPNQIYFWGTPEFPKDQAPSLDNFLLNWQAEGSAFLNRIMGSWALAARIENKIFLARDHFGFRPLYFRCHQNEVLVVPFQSSLASPLKDKLDENFIANFLLDDFSLFKHSFCSEVKQVAPGGVEQIVDRQIRSSKFPETKLLAPFKGSYLEAAEVWRSLILKSVQRNLKNESRVGLILSGGVDSSGLLAFIQKLRQEQQLNCELRIYHGEFADGAASTEGIAPALAKELGLSIFCAPIEKNPDKISWSPAENPWELPYYPTFQMYEPLLEQAAKDGCSAIVFGYGADEQLTPPLTFMVDLFTGLQWRRLYHHLVQKKFYDEPWKLVPRILLKPLIPKTLRKIWRHFYKKRRLPGPYLAHPDLQKVFFQAIERWNQSPKDLQDRARKGMWVRLKSWGGLQYSAEVHSLLCAKWGMRCHLPFFDADLIRFSLSVPLNYLIDEELGKGLLRQALKDLLPDWVRLKPKFQDYSNFAATLLNRQKKDWGVGRYLTQKGWLPENYWQDIFSKTPSHMEASFFLKIALIENITKHRGPNEPN